MQLITAAAGGAAVNRRARDPQRLTPREREIARLVADGLTNRSIAAQLHVSPWTVASHVAHVLEKRGFRSRAQIATWFAGTGIDEVDETERLEALRYYQVLDSDPEPAFDRITALAAKLLDTPIALISFVDERRQWFKSAHGLAVRETPREGGFCAAAITCETPTVVPDARISPQFANHAMVAGPPGIRLYAGAPLTTADGHNLGTVCVLDTKPRTLREDEVALLADLAALVMDQLERRMPALRLIESERLRREARRYAERMAELDRLKTEFLLLASHELRAPLSIVKGYTSMIADGSLGAVDARTRAVLPIMTSKVAQIEGLIDQVLESARLEQGERPIRLARFDIRAAVNELVQARGPADEDAAFKLDFPDQAVEVLADRTDVDVIIANLFSNAIKFSPATASVACRIRGDRKMALLDVSDRGLGIAAGDQERVFQRFGRLVTSDNSHIPGYGLGLFLSRELSRRLGGDLTVASEPGRGSTFTLSLPLA